MGLMDILGYGGYKFRFKINEGHDSQHFIILGSSLHISHLRASKKLFLYPLDNRLLMGDPKQ